ncbi:unnamed protein product [Eruca vesicaria subsp. sativa]|uniref:Uncharacterized protein n=1 Tax=Eruca vesicaria subsp. sativa TaxID=29727 RepID=A0ABC8M1D9_ERUVS|nr:unnamed protein product [Eruca vesicaria subsp. sativa]
MVTQPIWVRYCLVVQFDEMEDTERTPDVNTSSPDLLKNTPSNITRLEDVIEQCRARQKYLAQTANPSDCSDVCWYFCKVPLPDNEIAASVPRTDVIGKSEYLCLVIDVCIG